MSVDLDDVSPLLPPHDWIYLVDGWERKSMQQLQDTPEYRAELWTRRFSMLRDAEWRAGMREEGATDDWKRKCFENFLAKERGRK